ncbi:MAG: flagellin [Opitutae bacterium]|nr:flagellin [Opitutae bacterium]
MSLIISSNFAASYAARQLEINDDNLRNSLNKLSSGKRIVRPNDDAGGMAVQLKMRAAVNRGFAAKNNIQNAISLLQTQDGVLQTATSVIDRIAELKAMTNDPTKNSGDLQNYNEEYQVLRQQLLDLQSEAFNGISMFTATHGVTDGTQSGVFEVFTTEQGNSTNAPSVTINSVNLASGATSGALVTTSVSGGFSGDVTSTTSGGIADASLTMDSILVDLQNLANARAENGALQSRLGFSYDQASVSKSNMEAARSRIIDVDIAEESTKFATYQILTQASASILSQANQTGRTALQLLMP